LFSKQICLCVGLFFVINIIGRKAKNGNSTDLGCFS
jgi:hypothetical protein